jgi:pimeloyl-ACP methyl ester carboxylesterase
MTITTPACATRLVLIPGMGADKRLFDKLSFSGFEVLRTNWIAHEPSEDLQTYADRFARFHNLTSSDTLIGVSMGGIVAGTIAQAILPRQLIRISSCSHINQLSPFISTFSSLAAIAPFGLTRSLPRSLVPKPRRLFLEMFHQTDAHFMRWACRAISRWPGALQTVRTVIIHGTSDLVFPFRLQPKVDAAIPGGGHLMIYERAAEVESAILANLVRADEAFVLPITQTPPNW